MFCATKKTAIADITTTWGKSVFLMYLQMHKYIFSMQHIQGRESCSPEAPEHYLLSIAIIS